MKTKLFFTTVLSGVFLLTAQAQTTQISEFWGIRRDNAKIYKTDSVGENLQYIYTLNPGVDGQDPHTAPYLAGNGKLYGTCIHGGTGSDNFGTFYEFDIPTLTYNVLIDFNGENGALPEGNIIEASNGKFYGMTTEGGSSYDTIPPDQYYKINGWGTLFEYDPTTHTHTILYNFNYESGNYPRGDLMQGNDGYLYGTTSDKPKVGNYRGSLFRFDIETRTFTILHSFDYETGWSPYAGVLQASNGKLYGTTNRGGGGEFTGGVLYEYELTTNTYTILKRFTHNSSTDVWPDGCCPEAELIEGSNGKLYGVTGNGGEPRYTNDDGVLFSYDLTTHTFNRLYCFPESGAPGKWPNSKLIEASNGKFYGTNHERVYEYDPITGLVTGKSGGVSNYTGIVEVKVDYVSAAILETTHDDINVYPNPTSDIVVIQLNDINKKIRFELFDMAGKLLIQNDISNTGIEISMKEYKSGTYVLKLLDKKNRSIQDFKIIKR